MRQPGDKNPKTIFIKEFPGFQKKNFFLKKAKIFVDKIEFLYYYIYVIKNFQGISQNFQKSGFKNLYDTKF